MIPTFPRHGKPPSACVIASGMALSASFHAAMPAKSGGIIPGLATATRSPLLALADRCVQCGLCLPYCPTYRLDRNEAESPRGRIALARALADGSLPVTALAYAHLDHCLGCRRCEPVCPAGVDYGALLLETRREQRVRRHTSWRQISTEWLAARPRLLDRLFGAYRTFYLLLPKWLPRPPPARMTIATPTLQSSNATASGSPTDPRTASLFRGCIARCYDAGVHDALHRLCAATGIALIEPDTQTCCGALHAHAGNADAATALGAVNRAAFDAGTPC